MAFLCLLTCFIKFNFLDGMRRYSYRQTFQTSKSCTSDSTAYVSTLRLIESAGVPANSFRTKIAQYDHIRILTALCKLRSWKKNYFNNLRISHINNYYTNIVYCLLSEVYLMYTDVSETGAVFIIRCKGEWMDATQFGLLIIAQAPRPMSSYPSRFLVKMINNYVAERK
jgi:hypothetical protein